MQLPFADACERNKRPILDVLSQILPVEGRILEIGSGTGQHIVFFAPRFPDLLWQASDCRENLQGISLRIKEEGGANLLPPIELDVLERWPEQVFDAVISANTAHIMAWEGVCAMFAGLERHLAPGGVFSLYGPFNQGGHFTSPSNQEFDQQLRARCMHMGLRDIEDLESLAAKHQMRLERKFDMPANNQVLVFLKSQGNG
jgi:cyclopropane fatty-acyl-phospholipid synthase-like methyltransferase